MKQKIIELIKVITFLDEVGINIELSIGFFDTIEVYDEETVILHRFEDEDYDYYYYFDDLNESDKKKIYDNLKVLVYN